MISKLLPFLALSIGLGLTAWLVSAATLAAIFHSFAEIGWGIAAIVAVRAIVIATNGLAWARLLAELSNVPSRIFILLRWIREAIDVTLPVAYIGGGLVSARMLSFWGPSGSMATAGLVADVFLQTIAQALFALFGATLLARIVGPTILPPVLLGAAAACIVLGAFYVCNAIGALAPLSWCWRHWWRGWRRKPTKALPSIRRPSTKSGVGPGMC
jgi:hypothetical protein